MRDSLLKLFAPAIFQIGAALTATGAVWPAKVFAPYMYIGAGDNFQITNCEVACGQKFYTIAFVIADDHGRPAWDGRFPMEKNLYAAQIKEIRHCGGDVIVSFGGADGTEIAISETNTTALEEKYQSVIDRYQFTWLDFDIEGASLADKAANSRRNIVLAALQAKNPGLIVSFTLPVDPDGISRESQSLLSDAVSRRVKIHSVNVMTMDFGAHFSKGKKMSAVSIASALKARDQCRNIAPEIQIGITPMIGQNDEPGEVFTQQDARAVKKWAQGQPWVCSLSFWASNRDVGHMDKNKTGNDTSGIRQKPWEFTKIFKSFTSE
jgi:Glycosyl hydrolases family 18